MDRRNILQSLAALPVALCVAPGHSIARAKRVAIRKGNPPEPYARKGEVTYCENGHELGRFGRTVYCGKAASEGDLIATLPMRVGMTDCAHCHGAIMGEMGTYFFDLT